MREHIGENVNYKSKTAKEKLDELREEINLTQSGEYIEKEELKPEEEK